MRDHYLQTMGITRWVRRESDPVVLDDAEPEQKPPVEAQTELVTDVELTVVQTPDSHMVDELDWPELQQSVAACVACDLHATRTQTVFGSGNKQADWMIVGEAPGAEEEQQGMPFMGQSGQLLTAMIEAMGLKREQVYITNVLKCRPPENRDPDADEMMACHSFLRRQIALLQPKVILAVGRVAAQNILDSTELMKDLRGKAFEYKDSGIPVVATYHPAYLLRAPTEKRKAWQDLQMAMRIVAGEQQ